MTEPEIETISKTMNASLYNIYLARAQRFPEQLESMLFEETRAFSTEVLCSPLPLPVESQPPAGEYRPLRENENWGKLWDSGYFRLSGEIPEKWHGKDIWVDLEMGGEILLFDQNFTPLTSLTNSSTQILNFRKTLFPMETDVRLELFAEVAANGFADTADCEVGICRKLRYGLFRKNLWAFLIDFRTVLSLLAIHEKPPYPAVGGFHWHPEEVKAPSDFRAARLCRALNRAIDVFAENPDNTDRARAELAEILTAPASRHELSTVAVGHGHLDIGYLWPIRETKRKACRTFAGQLANIKQYPSYVFGASQPQLYQYVKESMPELYEQVKAAVRSGNWELQGGMWVESDCNAPAGESLIRQFLHGKNFFRDEFAVNVTTVWLPDIFGCTAAMPQIMKLAGCDYFMSQKISWSEFNRFPHHSFCWRGIGSAEVIAHFPAEDGYNSFLDPENLRFAENNFQENAFLDEFLTVFGVGDGGGGPKFEHIEAGLRAADLEDVPRLRFGTAESFFRRLSEHRSELPVWDGELYLEFHRGTYTNQGRIKRANRQLEQHFAAVEILLASMPAGQWPRAELDALWKTFLANQFHDIVPGSSLHEVHAETLADMADIAARLDSLVTTEFPAQDGTECLTLVNTLSTPYRRLLRLPEAWRNHEVLDRSGLPVPVQCDADGVWCASELPPLSSAVLRCGRQFASPAAEEKAELVLENRFVRAEFLENGTLKSLFDKVRKAEVLTAEGGNLLRLYSDKARIFPGWEVEATYRDISPQTASATEDAEVLHGLLRSRIRFHLRIGNSTVTQTAVLEWNSAGIDFETEVCFQEKEKLLRAEFPTTVLAREACCDIAHGFLRRPTHRNSSWEEAMFEFPIQRYVDLNDGKHGAALLNDGRYGASAHEGLLGLSLLRAPVGPDVERDAGTHVFTYRFLPHAGGEGELPPVQEEAAALNRAPLSLSGDVPALSALPFQLTGDGIEVEAFKRAEKSSDWILRLHEAHGNYAEAALRIKGGVSCFACDLLEWEEGEKLVPLEEDVIRLEFKPFEVRTFRLKERI